MEDYLINTTVDTKDYYAGNNQKQNIKIQDNVLFRKVLVFSQFRL
jgi:hypothetical protein